MTLKRDNWTNEKPPLVRCSCGMVMQLVWDQSGKRYICPNKDRNDYSLETGREVHVGEGA